MAKKGDRLVMTVKSKRVAPNQRAGTIDEVLAEGDRPRYSIRWDDGRSTVIAPHPGSFRVEAAKAKKAATAKTSAKAKEEPHKQATPRSVKLKTAPRRTKIKKG
jgi:hypothetical protein